MRKLTKVEQASIINFAANPTNHELLNPINKFKIEIFQKVCMSDGIYLSLTLKVERFILHCISVIL